MRLLKVLPLLFLTTTETQAQIIDKPANIQVICYAGNIVIYDGQVMDLHINAQGTSFIDKKSLTWNTFSPGTVCRAIFKEETKVK